MVYILGESIVRLNGFSRSEREFNPLNCEFAHHSYIFVNRASVAESIKAGEIRGENMEYCLIAYTVGYYGYFVDVMRTYI